MGSGLGLDEEFAGVGEGGFADFFSGEHSGDFLDAFFAFEFTDLGEGAAVVLDLFDAEMCAGASGDLREVADDDDLVVASQFFQFFGGDSCGASGEASIDFVEDQAGDTRASRGGDFDREHDAGEFAAGGNSAEGTGGFARVGGEIKADKVLTVWLDWAGFEVDHELGFGHRKVLEVRGDLVGELLRLFGAEGGEVVGEGLEEGFFLFEPGEDLFLV